MYSIITKLEARQHARSIFLSPQWDGLLSTRLGGPGPSVGVAGGNEVNKIWYTSQTYVLGVITYVLVLLNFQHESGTKLLKR